MVVKKINVLVIDDSSVWRKIIRHIFEDHGCLIIDEAHNGMEGLEKYMVKRPDLVTMDIEMPVMDGLTATRKILAFDREARIIMISSKGDEATVRKALLIGALDFISKGSVPNIQSQKIMRLIGACTPEPIVQSYCQPKVNHGVWEKFKNLSLFAFFNKKYFDKQGK